MVNGRRWPLHSTALGKAMLAAMEESEREQTLKRLRLTRRTAATITSRTALRADIRLAAERGYAIDAEENVEGGTCVAAAISGPRGAVLGAVSISFPSSRNGDRLDELGATVRSTANAISREAGARVPDPDKSSGRPSGNRRSAMALGS